MNSILGPKQLNLAFAPVFTSSSPPVCRTTSWLLLEQNECPEIYAIGLHKVWFHLRVVKFDESLPSATFSDQMWNEFRMLCGLERSPFNRQI